MENINIVESVTERDIDFLLLEELNVSADFSRWLYSSVVKKDDKPILKGAWHSISDPALGESDLIAIYENRVAILIENKIDAVAQPEQGQRYKARGDKGIEDGWWDCFFTCMVAPKKYLKNEQDSRVYDANLSYEAIGDWFASNGKTDRRSAHKRFLILEAIEQNRRGYKGATDDGVTKFWDEYHTLCNQHYPELEMKKPGLMPAGSDWPCFKPSTILDNKCLSIFHKLERGDVDLQIAGAAKQLEDVQNTIEQLKANGGGDEKQVKHLQRILSSVEVVKAGKSAAIKLKVDPIYKRKPFEAQKSSVMKGLDAARELLAVAQKLPKISNPAN